MHERTELSNLDCDNDGQKDWVCRDSSKCVWTMLSKSGCKSAALGCGDSAVKQLSSVCSELAPLPVSESSPLHKGAEGPRARAAETQTRLSRRPFGNRASCILCAPQTGPLDRLPADVWEVVENMVWNAAWHAANTRAGYGTDAARDKANFNVNADLKLPAIVEGLNLNGWTLFHLKW